MGSSFLFPDVLAILERGLDAASLRQTVIANNIANVDTPGFKRSEVVFESELAQALARQGLPQSPSGGYATKATSSLPTALAMVRTNPRHLMGFSPSGGTGLPEPRVVPITDTTARADGNNVDIDVEMSEMAENTLLYSALARQLSSHLDMVRQAITEGRR